jgi:hypothetical protein
VGCSSDLIQRSLPGPRTPFESYSIFRRGNSDLQFRVPCGVRWLVISGTFPLLAARSGAYPFLFFAAMVVLQFFVVLFTYYRALDRLKTSTELDSLKDT